MKIGILTFANVPNFGANLQALSTIYYLRSVGHEPIIIKWEPLDFEARFINIRDEQQVKSHFDFCKKYLPFTDICRTDKDVSDSIAKYEIEAVLIGSDAVLQHSSLLSRIQFPTKTLVRIAKTTSERVFPNAFWGTFYASLDKKIPMIIMSASSQNSKYKFISLKMKNRMYKCLTDFSYISVRDKWTQEMVSFISNRNIRPCITPDPVFAFNYNCKELIPSKEETLKKFCIPENYVLVSMKCRMLHNREWMNALKYCFLQKDLECVALPMPTGVTFEHNFKYEISCPLSPLDWYALIKYAKAYIGENMHPIVVALHNAVPCFSFDTYGVLKYARMYCDEKSSKIYDIMADFSLLSNRRNAYSRFWKCPKPETVLEMILSFDKEKCEAHSKIKIQQYKIMMSDIEKAIFEFR